MNTIWVLLALAAVSGSDNDQLIDAFEYRSRARHGKCGSTMAIAGGRNESEWWRTAVGACWNCRCRSPRSRNWSASTSIATSS